MRADPIAEYLAELRAGLRTTPARTDEIVAEAEDHLRESAAARRSGGRRADGLAEDAAQRAAIAAFGPVRRIIRAHRPPASAYALAAAMKAWPLLVGYLLLSAVLGVLMLWEEGVTASGHRMTVVRGKNHQVVAFVFGAPAIGQLVTAIGGCVLAGIVLSAGFVVVRRWFRRSGRALVQLPPGLFPLAAAVALLALGVGGFQTAIGYWRGSLATDGLYQLAVGGDAAALLLGVGCGMAALVLFTRSAPAAAPGRPRASRYAVAAALRACSLLSGYLLLTAVLSAAMLYGNGDDAYASWYDWPRLISLLGGGLAVGGLLLVGYGLALRRCRRSGLLPARLPWGPAALVSAAGLLAVSAEVYLFFCSDVNGQLRLAPGLDIMLLCSQYALVVLGVTGLLRLLHTLASRALTGRRAARPPAPPEEGALAPAR